MLIQEAKFLTQTPACYICFKLSLGAIPHTSSCGALQKGHYEVVEVQAQE